MVLTVVVVVCCQAEAEGRPPQYDGTWRDADPAEVRRHINQWQMIGRYISHLCARHSHGQCQYHVVTIVMITLAPKEASLVQWLTHFFFLWSYMHVCVYEDILTIFIYVQPKTPAAPQFIDTSTHMHQTTFLVRPLIRVQAKPPWKHIHPSIHTWTTGLPGLSGPSSQSRPSHFRSCQHNRHRQISDTHYYLHDREHGQRAHEANGWMDKWSDDGYDMIIIS